MVTRLFLILITPQFNYNIDLCIYIDGGELLSNKINPYDFTDKVDIRHSLRTDDKAYHYWTCGTQEKWNYYASSNLPLTLLLFGIIDFVSSTPIAYRVTFALFDSILSVIIALFIWKNWRIDLNSMKLILILSISALSPTLLIWGTLIPEDKGVQIFLMIAAIYFSQSSNKYVSILLSSFFLGCSIAFKLVGVFIIPLCLYYSFVKFNHRGYDKGKLKHVILYIFLTTVFVFVWFIPFMPEVFTVTINRLFRSIGSSIPIHGSPWRLFYLLLPNSWNYIRNFIIFSFLILTALGIYRKKIEWEIVCGNLLITFLLLVLFGGSLDRNNIGIITTTLLIGSIMLKNGIIMIAYHFTAGFLILIIIVLNEYFMSYFSLPTVLQDYEFLSSIFSLLFLLIYFGLFIEIMRKRKQV